MAEFSQNNSKHSATNLTPFFANNGFHPRMSLLPASPDSATPAADSYVQRLHAAQTILKRELLKAQKAMETSAHRRRRRAQNFVPGQKVWLLRHHISTTRPSSKLDVRRLGPFVIIGQVGSTAFHLDLPPSMQIHPVFHVSLIFKTRSRAASWTSLRPSRWTGSLNSKFNLSSTLGSGAANSSILSIG